MADWAEGFFRFRGREYRTEGDMTWKNFSSLYCETQDCDEETLFNRLMKQREQWQPDGWFMLECQVLDSSRLGERVILPYGPNNTFKAVPEGPVSPRGLASDMSVVIAKLSREDF